MRNKTAQNIVYPGSPPINFATEVESILEQARYDKQALLALGMDWQLVQGIPPLLENYKESQRNWKAELNVDTNSAKHKWRIEEKKLIKIRQQLVEKLRFAFRHNKELLALIPPHSEGYGQMDQIKYVLRLCRLGKDNQDNLLAINYDMNNLDQIIQTAKSLLPLCSASIEIWNGKSKIKKTRDEAFARLRESVMVLQEYGRHLHCNNKPFREKYRTSI